MPGVVPLVVADPLPQIVHDRIARRDALEASADRDDVVLDLHGRRAQLVGEDRQAGRIGDAAPESAAWRRDGPGVECPWRGKPFSPAGRERARHDERQHRQ